MGPNNSFASEERPQNEDLRRASMYSDKASQYIVCPGCATNGFHPHKSGCLKAQEVENGG